MRSLQQQRTRTSCKTLFPMDLVLPYKAFSNGNGGFETGFLASCREAGLRVDSKVPAELEVAP